MRESKKCKCIFLFTNVLAPCTVRVCVLYIHFQLHTARAIFFSFFLEFITMSLFKCYNYACSRYFAEVLRTVMQVLSWEKSAV